MTKILDVLNNRVTYITIIFGLFGGALSFLLKIEDMKTYYPALASLIALVVSLLVSLLIKGKRDRKSRKRLNVWALILFILFLGFAALHTNYVITKTFEYQEFDEANRYIKGNYSQTALELKKKYSHLSDSQILYQKMSGVDSIKQFWTPESVDMNVFILIATYCGVVLCFVAVITLVTELLAEDKTTTKGQNGKTLSSPQIKSEV